MDIVLVYVVTPPKAHVPLVEEIIAAKRHVLCEKPFTMGPADAAHLANLAAKAGLVNAIDHEMRYSSIYRGMKEYVSSNYIGDMVMSALTVAADYAVNPEVVTAYYWSFTSSRAEGGGLLISHLCHFIDLYQFILGGLEPHGGYTGTMIKEKPLPIDSIDATGKRVFTAGQLKPVDTDDVVAVSGCLPNGAAASLTATWSTPAASGVRWLLQGSEGVLIYQSEDAVGLWNGDVIGARGKDPIAKVALPPVTISVDDPDGSLYMSRLLAAELLDIANVIDKGGEGNFATFASECKVWDAINSWRKV
jgi:predicted dehydrogenase